MVVLANRFKSIQNYRMNDRSERLDDNRVSFADMLRAVVDGKIKGYLVLKGEDDIHYEFIEDGEELGDVGEDAIVQPLDPQFAYFMLTELPPEELAGTS